MRPRKLIPRPIPYTLPRPRQLLPRFGLFGLLLLAQFAGGCARQPPNSNFLSGKRLLVTATYRGAINPLYYYFFVINVSNNQNAPGPIAVFNLPYGNGFATGSGAGATGFTDFVQYGTQPYGGYGLYHVVGDPNLHASLQLKGGPVSYTTPNPDDTTYNQLQFQIDLAQLIYDANGNPLTNASEAATLAKQISWVQINFISTDQVPYDSTTQIIKYVDALGDTRNNITSDTSFVAFNLQTTSSISNSLVGPSSPAYEPSEEDVYPGNNDSLDLIDWNIQVVQQ